MGSRFHAGGRECPRQESNLRTRFRKPLLYPLSYGGRITPFAACFCVVPPGVYRGAWRRCDPVFYSRRPAHHGDVTREALRVGSSACAAATTSRDERSANDEDMGCAFHTRIHARSSRGGLSPRLTGACAESDRAAPLEANPDVRDMRTTRDGRATSLNTGRQPLASKSDSCAQDAQRSDPRLLARLS